MKLRCKKTFFHHDMDLFILGQFYEVLKIHTNDQPSNEAWSFALNTLNLENTWLIQGEKNLNKSFRGPDEVTSEGDYWDLLCTKNKLTPQRLIEYFYLPDEWREIQLQQILKNDTM